MAESNAPTSPAAATTAANPPDAGNRPDPVRQEPVNAGEETHVLKAPDSGGPATYVWGVGRRKSSVARVRLNAGSGKVRINRRELNDYFHNERDRKAIFGPLEATQYGGRVDVMITTDGGGSTGQAGAIVMGLARALIRYDAAAERVLRDSGYLTRDSRMKERKKYGQRGARRRFQFSKR